MRGRAGAWLRGNAAGERGNESTSACRSAVVASARSALSCGTSTGRLARQRGEGVRLEVFEIGVQARLGNAHIGQPPEPLGRFAVALLVETGPAGSVVELGMIDVHAQPFVQRGGPHERLARVAVRL